MKSLNRSHDVLELGKRLVAELESDADLLAQWMAHDIAARIVQAESADNETQMSARDACSRSILALWEHRNTLPPHLRPFRELEPLIRTLVALDVDKGEDYRYFSRFLRQAAVADVDGEKKKWLDLALGLDYVTRVSIQWALRNAGIDTASEAESWIELSLNAGVDPIAERSVTELITSDFGSASDDMTKQKMDLHNKIEKLEAFAEIAADLAAQLQDQLDAMTDGGSSKEEQSTDSNGYSQS